jgi:hypothetical protein
MASSPGDLGFRNDAMQLREMFWTLNIEIWDLPAQLNWLLWFSGLVNIVILIINMVMQIIELFNRVNILVLEIWDFIIR